MAHLWLAFLVAVGPATGQEPGEELRWMSDQFTLSTGCAPVGLRVISVGNCINHCRIPAAALARPHTVQPFGAA